AGLGHMSLWLAQRGHQVTLAEPAETMLDGARERFAEVGLEHGEADGALGAAVDLLREARGEGVEMAVVG
ncbi:hypothetical protein R0G64_32575, partial [Pseudomonas otitidis]|nr:hypothetical protein [Pseudomonas otitidis]